MSETVLRMRYMILNMTHLYLNTEKVVEQSHHIVKMQEKAATRMSAHKKSNSFLNKIFVCVRKQL
jgi:hypothetical protein